MIVLDGGREKTLSRDGLLDLAARFSRVALDAGTGDGRNVYKRAKADPKTLFIGFDPAADNLRTLSGKIVKKPEKGGLPNVLYAIFAVEALPDELDALCDEATVFFPWGTLLEWIAGADPRALLPMRRAMKKGADFEFVLTYSPDYEPAEIARRNLPPLSRAYLEGSYADKLSEMGFHIRSVEELDNACARAFDSAWAKKTRLRPPARLLAHPGTGRLSLRRSGFRRVRGCLDTGSFIS